MIGWCCGCRMSKMTFTRKVSKKHVGVYAVFWPTTWTVNTCLCAHLHLNQPFRRNLATRACRSSRASDHFYAPLMRPYVVDRHLSPRNAKSFPRVS